MDPVDLRFAFLAVFTFLVAYAVITDVSRLIIPNWVSIALVMLFIAFLLLGGKSLPVLQHALVAAAMLLLGFAVFAAGFIGAGDVKLMAAVALWTGPDKLLPFLFYMSLAGAALAFVIVAGGLYLRWIDVREPATGLSRILPRWVRRGLTPYGLAIGAGALATVPAQFF
jgi:prepilin peptidase CpaA